MRKSWTATVLPDEVAVKPGFSGSKAELFCKLHKNPLRVKGTLLLDTNLPHEIVTQMPDLRDIRVILRFNEKESHDAQGTD